MEYQHVDKDNEKGNSVNTGEVGDLNQRQIAVLGIAEVFPGESRQQMCLPVLQDYPDNRRHQPERRPPLLEKGHGSGKKAGVDAQVGGQQEHRGHPHRIGEIAVIDHHIDDPVHDADVGRQTRRQTQQEALARILVAEGVKQGDQAAPGENTGTELGKGEDQKNARSQGQQQVMGAGKYPPALNIPGCPFRHPF